MFVSNVSCLIALLKRVYSKHCPVFLLHAHVWVCEAPLAQGEAWKE